jgi:hypothetical protein
MPYQLINTCGRDNWIKLSGKRQRPQDITEGDRIRAYHCPVKAGYFYFCEVNCE